jgi:hypothetical protein
MNHMVGNELVQGMIEKASKTTEKYHTKHGNWVAM